MLDAVAAAAEPTGLAVLLRMLLAEVVPAPPAADAHHDNGTWYINQGTAVGMQGAQAFSWCDIGQACCRQ